jgi:hypothetical protein
MTQPPDVLAGLVPAIHAAGLQPVSEEGVQGTAWMPGTRPGMTVRRTALGARASGDYAGMNATFISIRPSGQASTRRPGPCGPISKPR